MTTTHTAWITVGDNDWRTLAGLASGVRRIIDRLSLTLVTEATTVGEWDGHKEAGLAFLVSFDANQETLIRAGLSQVAADNGQDAIGFVGTCGGETLVTP